jgi:ribosomal protein S18 acetylase RimI-like enzyme
MAFCLPATVADIPALVALENTVFQTDRISRRQFHYLLTKGRAAVVKAVASETSGQTLAGAMALLFRRGSDRARIYSLAVAPEARRQGIAQRLLAYAEEESRRRSMKGIVLEVREDNQEALALYRTAGFQRIGRRLNYYEDGAAAARLGKVFARAEEAKR